MISGRNVRYKTLAVGAKGDVVNTAPRTIEWDMQTLTFVLSLLFQLATLIISAITLAQSGPPNEAPPLLIVVVTMELIVQCIEIVWYTTVGIFYYLGRASIGVRYRYYDWFVTTPVMLSALLFFVWYLECNPATGSDIFNNSSKVITIVCVVVFDWMMLFFGYVYEAEVDWAINFLDFMGNGTGLWLGWLPFLGVFIPMVVSLSTAKIDNNEFWGWFSVLVTFGTWGLYGVVALAFRRPDQAKVKNTSYNLLDIVSKNIMGIVTSLVTLNLSSGTPTNPLYNATCVANLIAS